MSARIPVGISACLPGDNARFNDGYQRGAFAAEELAPFFHYEPVFPEMVPAPRPVRGLIKNREKERERCFGNGDPVSREMARFTENKFARLHHLCGYIACAESPSCGMADCKPDNNDSRKESVGMFTQELIKQMPWLPVEEADSLHDPSLRENFIERVCTLHEFNQLWRSGLTRGKLIAFHSRYKLLLLAHSQPHYREMGRFVAAMGSWSPEVFAFAYRQRLMDLLKHKATRSNHTNVLMHVQGYFRPRLTSEQRQELASLIDRYRQGMLPLLAPVTLIKHYLAAFPQPYLAQQRYFSPWPDAFRTTKD